MTTSTSPAASSGTSIVTQSSLGTPAIGVTPTTLASNSPTIARTEDGAKARAIETDPGARRDGEGLAVCGAGPRRNTAGPRLGDAAAVERGARKTRRRGRRHDEV